jgi:hypothetical protein
MKVRILNFGIESSHEQIRLLDDLFSDLAFNDFDAFVFDPAEIESELRVSGTAANDRTTVVEDYSGSRRSTLNRHSREIFELVYYKGGVVVCILRDNNFMFKAEYRDIYSTKIVYENYNPYFLLERICSQSDKPKLLKSFVSGEGEQIRFAAGISPSYLSILKNSLRFYAAISPEAQDELTSVFARDSIGRIVAAEVKIGAGTLLFVPDTTEQDSERVGAALVQTVRELIAKDTPDITPAWVNEVTVPKSESNNAEIESVRQEREILSQRLEALETEKAELLKHRHLLYTTGKFVLEPAVRRAFRTLGYSVSEPDTYDGEWDIEMRDRKGSLLIGEVEGPEGQVDVEKYRQALDYHQDKFLEGEDNKPLLVGNAHRLIQIDQRPDAFTDHAIRGATKNGMALISTPDLFRAVCAVLANDSQELKAEIQDSIAACAGVWNWPPLRAEETESEPEAISE